MPRLAYDEEVEARRFARKCAKALIEMGVNPAVLPKIEVYTAYPIEGLPAFVKGCETVMEAFAKGEVPGDG